MKVLFFFIAAIQIADGFDTLRYDLSQQWRVSDDGNVLEFKLTPNQSGILMVKSPNSISVFINSELKLLGTKSFAWPTDSLISAYASQPVQIKIVSKYGTGNVAAILQSVTSTRSINKRNNPFSNAIVVIGLVMALMLIALLRVWPQTILGYYNFIRAFTLRTSEESFITIRVTSLNNLLVYIFTALLAATNLELLNGYAAAWSEWIGIRIIMVSLVVLSLLIGKIILLNLLSAVYKLSEIAPMQFYNFVTALLTFFTVSLIILLTIFMAGGNIILFKPVFNWGLLFLTIAFESATFLKLAARGGFTVFHLFSYLCTSELIPLTILFTIVFS